MALLKKFKDDVIVHKELDIEKIQTATHMYISYKGEKGSLHLFKELFNNGTDEQTNENSPCDTLDIHLDAPERSVSVRDNGRGIPHEMLEIVCTTIQSGSKFGRRGSGGASAGQNGVGLTAINALSEYFQMTSYRPSGEKRTIIFNEGKKVEDRIEKCNPNEHGTFVKFIPSKKYMGKKCDIQVEDLMAWLNKIVYTLPQDLTVNLNIDRVGKTSSVHTTLKNKNGMYDFMKKHATNLIMDPIHIKDMVNAKEIILNEKGDEEEVDRRLGIEAAISFTTDDIPFRDAFCNFINNIDGGTHLTAVEEGVTQYLFKETKEALTEREKKNLEIKYLDVTSNLSIAVNMYTDLDPEFSGQTKEKVTSQPIIKPIKEMVIKSLKEYFKNNPKDLKRCTDLIKSIAKARYESQKVRNSVIKGKNNSLDEHKIKQFRPAINRKGKELYITEGDSALGSALSARNPNTQAIFAVQGVPANTFKTDLAKALSNEEIKALVTVIGTNIGSKFDMKGLKYDKIIIMTDGDVDGANITSLLCAFFIKHMPELVEAGKIYKALPPLYKLKGDIFVNDKKAYIELMEERISKSVKFYTLKDELLTRTQVRQLLMANRLYEEILENTASNLSADPLFTEFLVAHFNDKNFIKLLAKNYPEISVEEDGSFVSGIVDNKLQSILINKMYYKRIEDLQNLIFNVNKGQIYYRVVEIDKRNGDIDRGVVSLGGMFKLVQRFRPAIETRYKGLGELPPKQLWETTMNPENRTLIKMTIQDMERELQIFEMLHGRDEGNKEMMRNYKIAREDLDN